MFRELIMCLYDFAANNDLNVEFYVKKDECTFVLQNRERTWVYNNTIQKEHIIYSSFDAKQYAEYTVNRVRGKLLDKGVIQLHKKEGE